MSRWPASGQPFLISTWSSSFRTNRRWTRWAFCRVSAVFVFVFHGLLVCFREADKTGYKIVRNIPGYKNRPPEKFRCANWCRSAFCSLKKMTWALPRHWVDNFTSSFPHMWTWSNRVVLWGEMIPFSKLITNPRDVWVTLICGAASAVFPSSGFACFLICWWD